MYNALKVIYYANKYHLSECGRFIYQDSYSAMKRGAVPSLAYDMIKYIRGDEGAIYFDEWEAIKDSFKVNGKYKLLPLRDTDLNYLSETDRRSLNKAIKEYGSMPFNELEEKSHNDPAFKMADRNDFIPFEAIVKSLPNSAEVLDYLAD